MTEAKMPFTKHLEELRRRIVVCAIAIAVGWAISYHFSEQIFEVLMQPWIAALPKGQEAKLIYTAPHEAFMTYLKVSFIGGVALATPVIFIELWRFVAPGLYQNEKKYVLPVVLFSTLFFLGGGFFGYFCVFPFGFKFFTSFASSEISPMITTREFLTFSTRILFSFGLIFELPVFTFFLARLKLVNARFLRRQRRYAIVLIFIVAAVLTPPDIFSQLLMAGPLLVLYEISVWIAHFFGPKDKAADKSLQKEQPDSA
jgi:sec-independent protein translocase protein TatC